MFSGLSKLLKQTSYFRPLGQPSAVKIFPDRTSRGSAPSGGTVCTRHCSGGKLSLGPEGVGHPQSLEVVSASGATLRSQRRKKSCVCGGVSLSPPPAPSAKAQPLFESWESRAAVAITSPSLRVLGTARSAACIHSFFPTVLANRCVISIT